MAALSITDELDMMIQTCKGVRRTKAVVDQFKALIKEKVKLNLTHVSVEQLCVLDSALQLVAQKKERFHYSTIIGELLELYSHLISHHRMTKSASLLVSGLEPIYNIMEPPNEEIRRAMESLQKEYYKSKKGIVPFLEPIVQAAMPAYPPSGRLGDLLGQNSAFNPVSASFLSNLTIEEGAALRATKVDSIPNTRYLFAPTYSCYDRKTNNPTDLTTDEAKYLARLNDISLYGDSSKKPLTRPQLCKTLGDAGLVLHNGLKTVQRDPVRRIKSPIEPPIGRFTEHPVERTLQRANEGRVYLEQFGLKSKKSKSKSNRKKSKSKSKKNKSKKSKSKKNKSKKNKSKKSKKSKKNKSKKNSKK